MALVTLLGGQLSARPLGPVSHLRRNLQARGGDPRVTERTSLAQSGLTEY